MKAITLWQPWASLIAVGAKQYETRSWYTQYKGDIAIHAAKVKKFPPTGVLGVIREIDLKPHELPYGVVVCIAEITACTEMDLELIAQQSIRESAVGGWAVGRYAWKLENIRRLQTPIPATGSQGFWNWNCPDHLIFSD